MQNSRPHIVSSNSAKAIADNAKSIIPNSNGSQALTSLRGELEKLLPTGDEAGGNFDKLIHAALRQTGHEFLFHFPVERFPISCRNAACVRWQDELESEDDYLYVFQSDDGGAIGIAEHSDLDEGFQDFARSFASVMEQLRDIIPANIH